jgi:hypothetical protein
MSILRFLGRADRRKSPRHQVIKTAWMRTKHDPLPSVCVLWDVSEGGARLAVARPEAVPDDLTIALNRDDKVGTACRVVWRSKEQVGLEFIANADPIRGFIRQAAQV